MILAYLLLICAAFTLVDFSLVQLVGEFLFTQKVQEEERIAASAAARASIVYLSGDADALYALLRELSGETDARILVTDRYGIVQSDSANGLNGRAFAGEEVAQVLMGSASAYGYYNVHPGTWLALTLASGSPVAVHAAPIDDAGVREGTLVYISSARELYESLTLIQSRILTWLILVAVLVLIVVVLLSGAFAAPIAELSQGIRKMAKGEMRAQVRVRGNSELANLARAFNQMSAQLDRLNTTRNEFVSNASHELKTPLSTIKILVETLLYQPTIDPDMTREFLGDINREINRLNLLVSDLLSLVRIDSQSMGLSLAKTSLSAIVEDTVRRIQPYAQSQQIALHSDVWDDVAVLGDEVKLSQVVYNLTDNAVKYTPAGGSVHLALAKRGKTAQLTVTDSGIGIPEKDIPHIFDRFYRVDKARSRETGGTGLGLAIVSQIVEMHGGSISVSSKEDVGTVFTVELPISGPAARNTQNAQ